MTTQLLVTSTVAETLLATAATGAGLLGPSTDRVLVGPDDDPAAVAAALGRDVELVVGSRTLPAGRALSRLFGDAPVTLLAVGAAAYGPTSGALQGRLAKRVRQVLAVDLVAGLDPLLLAERDVPTRQVPLEALRAAAAAWPGPAPVPHPTTLVLGRAAAWTGALDVEEQGDLLVAMVQRCAEAGHTRLVLLLDADVPGRTRRHLDKAARVARADLTVVTDDSPVEAWLALDGIGLVVGSATEDLLVARRVFGRRVAQLDSAVVLKHLEPVGPAPHARHPRRRHGARPPVVDLDARRRAGRAGRPGRADGDRAYVMEPDLLAARRPAALRFLDANPDVGRRFVRRRRLSELRLPGGKRKVRTTLG